MTTLDAPRHDTIRGPLARRAAQVRRRLLVRALVRTAALTLVCVALCVALDMALRLPDLARAALALATLGAASWALTRWAAPAWQARPGLTDMALMLVPESDPARVAALVELGEGLGSGSLGAALTQAIRERTPRPTLAPRAWRAAPMRETLALIALIALIVSVAAMNPSTTRIGLARLALPWGESRWPTRYAITLPEPVAHHPTHMGFEARATIGGAEGSPGPRLRWRIVDKSGRAVFAWTTTIPTPQPGAPGPGSRVHATIIPVHTMTEGSIPRGARLEYRFTSADDTSPIRRVELVRPPALESVRAVVTEPEYARSLSWPGALVRGAVESLRDDARVGPVLEGSRVELEWAFDKPVRPISDPDPDPSPVARTEMTAEDDTLVTVSVTDRYGYAPRQRPELFLRVRPDRAPRVALEEPGRDERVGPRAVIGVRAKASDDLGLASASVRAAIARPGETAEPEPIADASTASFPRETALDATLDIATLALPPGALVELDAIATDANATSTIGATRVIRVVEESEIVDRVREGLSGGAEALRRIDGTQRERRAEIDAGARVDPEAQRTITTLIESERRALRSIVERLERNNIDDAALSSLVDAVGGALADASDASDDAARALDKGDGDGAGVRMDRVRDALGRASALLDRGQDTWLARRAVDALRADLERLARETEAFGDANAGAAPEALDDASRRGLEGLAQRQRDAAQRARELLDELDAQSDRLEEANPAGARSLREAAQRGRAAGVSQRLREGAEQIDQNRTSSARRAQEDAIAALDEMLEQIDRAQEHRDAELRRMLASLIDTIRALRDAQRIQIERLDKGERPLDAPMIALRDATNAARDRAAEDLPGSTQVSGALGRAGAAQLDAVTALRDEPPDHASARAAELGALTHLESALREAERLDEEAADRESRRARDRLRAAYAEILDRHKDIAARTEPLVEGELDRRLRAAARSIAREQDGIRDSLRALLDESEGLGDAPVFELTHDRLDRTLDRIARSLREPRVAERVRTDQGVVTTLLEALVAALAPGAPEDADDGFREGASAGGGQGGSGARDEPLVPPIAQLRVLRTLQALANDRTRSLDESDDPDPRELGEIADLQDELARRGRELIEALNPTPPAPEEDRAAPPAPRPEPATDPEPDP